MKQIIHLSDLHIGGNTRLLNRKLKNRFDRLVEHLVSKHKPSKNFIIIISGDLTDNVFKHGYKAAKESIAKLTEANFMVLVIPGNHDYGDGKIDDKKYVELFKKAFYNDTSVTYPKKNIIDNIAFIGLDSMEEGWNNEDSEGKLGKVQIEELIKMINTDIDVVSCKYKVVYLHHHPVILPRYKGLQDAKEFQGAVKDKVDAIFFGHNHIPFLLKKSGLWGVPLWSNPGSSTGKEDYLPYISYFVFNLETGTDKKFEFVLN
ncbi:MAG: metallophosphoesterase [Thermodesulfobacteriota bacterium]